MVTATASATATAASACNRVERAVSASPALLWVARAVTLLGEPVLLTVASAVMAVVLVRQGRTRLAVVDPENSVFYDCWASGDRNLRGDKPSRIEGIGRPRCEPSFMPDVIDAMMKVPDEASVAAIRWLEGLLGRKCGA